MKATYSGIQTRVYAVWRLPKGPESHLVKCVSDGVGTGSNLSVTFSAARAATGQRVGEGERRRFWGFGGIAPRLRSSKAPGKPSGSNFRPGTHPPSHRGELCGVRRIINSARAEEYNHGKHLPPPHAEEDAAGLGRRLVRRRSLVEVDVDINNAAKNLRVSTPVDRHSKALQIYVAKAAGDPRRSGSTAARSSP